MIEYLFSLHISHYLVTNRVLILELRHRNNRCVKAIILWSPIRWLLHLDMPLWFLMPLMHRLLLRLRLLPDLGILTLRFLPLASLHHLHIVFTLPGLLETDWLLREHGLCVHHRRLWNRIRLCDFHRRGFCNLLRRLITFVHLMLKELLKTHAIRTLPCLLDRLGRFRLNFISNLWLFQDRGFLFLLDGFNSDFIKILRSTALC
jgi:hypothetical protein